MTTALPPATAAYTVAVGVLSLLSLVAANAKSLFALTPGHSILGEHHFWNVFTGCLIETNVVKLGLQIALIVYTGSKAEQGGNAMLTRRLGLGALVGTAGSGFLLTMFYLMGYMFLPGLEGKDEFLFDVHWFGSGPLLASFCVAAIQLMGDAPIIAGQEILCFSVLPLVAVAVSAVSQEVFATSQDLPMTLCSVLLTWVYLRFLHTYAPGSTGDTRDEFEFLALLPGPLRMPLRPAVKLLSAVFRGLPPFSRATGDGMRALPTLTAGAASAGTPSMITYGAGSGSSHWGGASSAINGGATEGRAGGAAAGGTNDPVAERRRERALRALDKKLAEMRVGMSSRGGGAPVTPGPALIPMPPTPVDGAGAGAAAPATPVNV